MRSFVVLLVLTGTAWAQGPGPACPMAAAHHGGDAVERSAAEHPHHVGAPASERPAGGPPAHPARDGTVPHGEAGCPMPTACGTVVVIASAGASTSIAADAIAHHPPAPSRPDDGVFPTHEPPPPRSRV